MSISTVYTEYRNMHLYIKRATHTHHTHALQIDGNDSIEKKREEM